MGKGKLHHTQQGIPEYDWEEIKRHVSKTDRWIVVEGYVYNVTRWSKKHPGGERIIAHYAGQDATEVWNAFHMHTKAHVTKYMKPLVVGKVKEMADSAVIVTERSAILDDFHKLRNIAEDLGLFRPNALFYIAILAHILLLDILAWFVMRQFGTGWVPYLIASVMLATSQAQAGWAQHDYGHLSVFRNSKWNHAVQLFILNFIKGASCDWWNYRHNNHHAKPNVVKKDPDIRLDMFFILGKVLPKEWAEKKRGFMPYNYQHKYWYFILPPLLLPLYFNYEIPYYLISRRRWMDLFWMETFWVRWLIMFQPLLGFWGAVCLYLFVRFLESHWFVWATQMSHLPMEVDYERDRDWVTMQLKATCNVDQSWFNDWWSGHLNFQIEHHLFPTMPRHNLHKITPLVKSMCAKYGLEYQSKPLTTAFSDITSSLKASGELWYESYNM